MTFVDVVHVIVMVVFLIGIFFAWISLATDEGIKSLREANQIILGFFALVGGAAGVSACLKGISAATGFPLGKILMFFTDALPAVAVVLFLGGLTIVGILIPGKSRKKKRKKKGTVVLTPDMLADPSIRINLKKPTDETFP